MVDRFMAFDSIISCFALHVFQISGGQEVSLGGSRFRSRQCWAAYLLANLRQWAWWKEEEEVVRVRLPAAETQAHAGVDFEFVAGILGKAQGIPVGGGGEESVRSPSWPSRIRGMRK